MQVLRTEYEKYDYQYGNKIFFVFETTVLPKEKLINMLCEQSQFNGWHSIMNIETTL